MRIRWRHYMVNALLFGASLCLAMGLAEVVLRIAAPQDLSGVWRTVTDKGLTVNRSSGTVRHQHGDRVVHYAFAEPHLRGAPLRPSERRVLVLGDSFTFGWLVDEDSSFVGRLQERLDTQFGPDTLRLVNAARGGWGTADYLAYTEDFGDAVAPEAVVVFLNRNDIGRSLFAEHYAFATEDSLALRRIPRDPSLSDLVTNARNQFSGYNWLLEHVHIVQFLRVGLGPLIHRAALPERAAQVRRGAELPRGFPGMDPGQTNPFAQALFLRLKAWCEAREIPLLVASTGWPDVAAGNLMTPTRAFLAEADSFFAAHAIPYHDIRSVIDAHVDTTSETGYAAWIVEDRSHPNERGHALIADANWPFLREQLRGLFP